MILTIKTDIDIIWLIITYDNKENKFLMQK